MNTHTRSLFSALVLLSVSIGSASAQGRKASHFDIRSDDSETSRATVQSLRAGSASKGGNSGSLQSSMAEGRAQLAKTVPGIQVEVNPVTKAPEVVNAAMGAATLTPPTGNSHEAVVRNFLATNAALFGLTKAQAGALKTTVDTTNPAGNLSWVEVEQSLNGIPVFQGTLRAALKPDGSILSTTGNLAAGLNAASLPTTPKISAADAAAAAAATIGVTADAASMQPTSTTNEGRTQTLAQGPFVRETKADLVYFPLEPGVATLAYSMVLWEKKDAWYTLVDAQSGQLLWRKNITNDQSQAVTYNVYDSDSPNPISPTNAFPGSGIQGAAVPRVNFTFVSELPAFDNLGWITDDGVGGTANAITLGNNVDAGLDLDTNDGIDANGRAIGTGRVFNFNYIPGGQPGEQSPTVAAYRSGVVTNLFFWSNRYHDRMYTYGFTEASRNFQTNNFGRGGSGNDPVLAQAQDGGGTNNANFSTPPDGQSGRMQMYIFDQPNPNRDGDLDQEIVIHELTHGLSNRLHANGSGLNTAQAGGMGEGWSDFYARALLSTAGEDVNGVYAAGAYATRDFFGLGTDNSYYGIRRFPYAVKTATGPNGKPHNPMTFGEIDPGKIFTGDGAYGKSPIFANTAQEVHAIGEIWCLALLEVRARMITRLGFPAGNDRVLQIVTDAMKIDPASPTLIQARNSIVTIASGNAADLDDVWNGFAAMGMGFNASVTNTNQNPSTVVESFIAPNLVLSLLPVTDANFPKGNLSFTDIGPGTSGNGDGFADPGEVIVLQVPVSNLASLGKGSATTVTASVAGGAPVSYGTIAPGATSTQAISYFVPVGAPAGTRLQLDVAIDSSLGPVGPLPQSFFLTVGQAVNGFVENFDATSGSSLPTGWTSARTGAGVAWVSSTTSPDSGTKDVFTPDIGSAGSASITTPGIAITSPASILTFRNLFNLETSPGFAFWDGMVLEISMNGGTFTDIIEAGGTFLSGGYNATLEYTGNPLAQRNAWSGLSAGSSAAPGYITTTVLLPASATGKTVRLRWIVGCDETAVASGAAGARIDSIALSTGAILGPTNRPPIINNQTFSVEEHSPLPTVVGTVAATDPDAGQTLTYAITAGNTGNAFALDSATGELSVIADLERDITPQFSLTVQVTDNAAVPKSSSATITVKIQGDVPPVITGNNVVSIAEEGSRAITLADLIVSDSDSVYPDDFTLTVQNGVAYTHVGNTVTPVTDFNGMLTVKVKVNDSLHDSNVYDLPVTVTPVNDAPSFVKGPDQAIIADGQQRTVSPWATAILTGPLDEQAGGANAQTANFTVTTSNDSFFSSLPTVDANGTLKFTAQLGTLGSVTVTVVMHDDGGSPGVDFSPPQSFVITSTAVTNDPPTFAVGPDQAAAQDAGPQTVANFVTDISPGPPDEVLALQTVSFIVTVPVAQQGLFSQPPSIDGTGKLTYTPNPTASGDATVTVVAHDNGPAGPNDQPDSAPQTFVISITKFAGHEGIYNGLAMPALGVLRSADKTGVITLKLTDSQSFTGKLNLGTSKFTLKGMVDNAGVLHFATKGGLVTTLTLERKGLPSLFLALGVDVIGTSDQVKGTIRGDVGPPTSDILADRAAYSKDLPPPQSLQGQYTVIFDQPKSLTLLPADLPQGDGYASVEVSEAGKVAIDGYLADGTHVKYSNTLSKTNVWPLYFPIAKGNGAIAGRVQFRTLPIVGPPVSDLDGVDLLWFRPVDLKSKKALYPKGWRQGITTTLIGSTYVPNKESAVVCIDPTAAPVIGRRVNLTLSGANQNPPLIRTFKIEGTKFINVANSNNGVLYQDATLKFNTKDGTFEGTYVHSIKGKHSFDGAALQKQKMGSGFFTGEQFNTTGGVTLELLP